MSLNTLMRFKKIIRHEKPVLVPASPINIYFDDPNENDTPYILNYVILSPLAEALPKTEHFETYAQAHRRMNQVRILQGYEPIPQPQPIKL